MKTTLGNRKETAFGKLLASRLAPLMSLAKSETPYVVSYNYFAARRAAGLASASLLMLFGFALSLSGSPGDRAGAATWPQAYTVQRDDAAGLLTLSTPFYTVQHDLKKGGAIARIQLTHGRSTNLLVRPLETRVEDEQGAAFSDLNNLGPSVSHRQDGLTERVTVVCGLRDEQGRPSGLEVKTVFEYHWGYVKIHKELTASARPFRARTVCVLSTTLVPSLASYGYREGLTEQEGAPPFAFGSCRWGKLKPAGSAEAALKTAYLPRYLMFANAGVEGLEWFMGSDLAQWELQLSGQRGRGQCVVRPAREPAGIAVAISPFQDAAKPVALPGACVFDCYLGLPILEGHARKPWFHASFNRNRGDWVAPEQVRRWAEAGIQTVHCHNDGDYYEDGLFWRDGSYPPYPDMEKYNQAIAEFHRAGIRVGTYFSNKELHPSTPEFQAHGVEWGRKNLKGDLQHNFYRGTNEFGAQMCLRSGWLGFLKSSIERVLKNHPLDGVYYDWNVALLCCNTLHEGKAPGESAAGHWDIEELLELMESTRQRVGPEGLVIVHNTTVPMFATENFADDIVANEWGYGKWTDPGPALEELPLEWSLVGARPRGVISYGQLDSQAPRRLHRLFALEALLGGVAPWPASPEAFELFAALKPLGDLETCRFADWRNAAVSLKGGRCGTAIYSRPGESYVVLGNLESAPQEVRCTVGPEKLPYPLASLTKAVVVGGSVGPGSGPDQKVAATLDVRQLLGEGAMITIPGDGVVVLRIQ